MVKKEKKKSNKKVLETKEKVNGKKSDKTKEKKEGYFKLLKGQLKMVKWPNGKDMFKYTFSTILFILLLVLFFQLVDVISSFVKGMF